MSHEENDDCDIDRMTAAARDIGAALDGCNATERTRVLAASAILNDVAPDVALALADAKTLAAKTAGAAANFALRRYGELVESVDITTRTDEYGEGWNAAIRHIAAKLRGRKVSDSATMSD